VEFGWPGDGQANDRVISGNWNVMADLRPDKELFVPRMENSMIIATFDLS
jgi:hypothetical protein